MQLFTPARLLFAVTATIGSVTTSLVAMDANKWVILGGTALTTFLSVLLGISNPIQASRADIETAKAAIAATKDEGTGS